MLKLNKVFDSGKVALAWELLFVVHAPVIRGSKKQRIASHVDGIFLRANNSCRIADWRQM